MLSQMELRCRCGASASCTSCATPSSTEVSNLDPDAAIEVKRRTPHAQAVTLPLRQIDSIVVRKQPSSSLWVVAVLDRAQGTTVLVDCLDEDEAEALARELSDAARAALR